MTGVVRGGEEIAADYTKGTSVSMLLNFPMVALDFFLLSWEPVFLQLVD